MNESESFLLDITSASENEKKTNIKHVYQIIRHFSNACEQGNIKQIERFRSNYKILQNQEPLTHLRPDIFSTEESKKEFRQHVLDLIFTECYNLAQNDPDELLFFASAIFEIQKLQEIVAEFAKDPNFPQCVNQLRYSDSVIIFLLKYANINNENFVECLRRLIEAEVDINKYDIKGKSAIDYVAVLHEQNRNDEAVSKTLKEVALLLLDKGIYKSENKKTNDFLTQEMGLVDYNYVPMDEKSKLFYWISKNKIKQLLEFKGIDKYVECDNGENTLLQLLCKKTDNMWPVVQYLLKNKADPNQVTRWNNLTPLELAALNNNQKIFEEILKNKRTRIQNKQFQNLVRWRSGHMKAKLFELFLESDQMDPNFTYERTGNTPLHYAVLFSCKKATQKLLKKGASLVLKNRFDKCVLDLIDPIDLEHYFDTCLALDNYTAYFTDINCKMKLYFNSLIFDRKFEEAYVVSKIGQSGNLQHLLGHPLIHTFINLKWFKLRLYFWLFLLLQATIFILLSIFFYHLPHGSSIVFACCILTTFINIAIKSLIFFNFRLTTGRYPIFFALNQARLHGSFEILLIISTVGGFFQNQFRAFAYIEMAIAFLLTAGYHPKLSKWSVMLQRVFKTFTILLVFFSLIVVAFSIGFNILFDHDHSLFQHPLTSAFKTYIMTTGEFDINNINFGPPGFGGYLLFFIFAMYISLVIVNFWTGVAVTDIERIEKDSEINAFTNVILFMNFVDNLYGIKYVKNIRKYILSPLLFLTIDGTEIYHDVKNCEIDFYVNKSKQFDGRPDYPLKVDDDCFNKIRIHYHKLKQTTNEKTILAKLEEMSKTLNELKANRASRNN